MSGDDFLSRWSRRKHAVRRGEEPEPAPKPEAIVPVAGAATASVEQPKAAVQLPPVESLTPDSDFSPFMGKEVDPLLRRTALKTLFRDPRFNVMDGLDVYIDDYSKPDPIPPEWLGKLNQMARLGDYAKTEADSKAALEGEDAADPVQVRAENQEVVTQGPAADGEPRTEGSPHQDLKES